MVIKDTEMELLVRDTDTGTGFLIWMTAMIGPFAVILPVFSWDVRARFRWKKGLMDWAGYRFNYFVRNNDLRS